jgi:hypothetical protein
LCGREHHETGGGCHDREQLESVFEISAHVILPDSPPARDVEAQRLWRRAVPVSGCEKKWSAGIRATLWYQKQHQRAEGTMLSYATIGSNRLDEAKVFYDKLLASAGITRLFEHPSGGRIYGKDGRTVFGVVGPYNGEPATVGNGTMLAFHFATPDEVTAFYRKALELGAKDEGAPGFRHGSPFFMSYFRDLDGNKLCAYHQAKAV